MEHQIGNGVLQKEFDDFLEKSPFRGAHPSSQQYIGMYGAFMAGYIRHQEEVLKELTK